MDMEIKEVFQNIAFEILSGDPISEYRTRLQINVLLNGSSENRQTFLKCLQSLAPRSYLEHASYTLLSDLLGDLLDLCVKESDYASIARIYFISRVFGMHSGGVNITLAMTLRTHAAFKITQFWVEETTASVSRDIIRWRRLADTPAALAFKPLQPMLELSSAKIYTLFIICRTHVMFTSMQYLRLPLEVLGEYLREVSDRFNLEEAGVCVTDPMPNSFLHWAVDIALAAKALPGSTPVSSAVAALMEDCVEGKVSDCCGFSPLLELLFCALEKVNTTTREAMHAPCICGGFIAPWNALGVDPTGKSKATEVSGRGGINRLLCEGCFRQLYSHPLKSDGMQPRQGFCVVPQGKGIPPSSSIFRDDGEDSPELDSVDLSTVTSLYTSTVAPREPSFFRRRASQASSMTREMFRRLSMSLLEAPGFLPQLAQANKPSSR